MGDMPKYNLYVCDWNGEINKDDDGIPLWLNKSKDGLVYLSGKRKDGRKLVAFETKKKTSGEPKEKDMW